MTKKELKELIKEVINEAKFDDMQIKSPSDMDYSDVKPGQGITVQEMQSSVNMLKKFLKLGQYVLPKNMLSSFREYIADIERDLAEISQLQSATPFNKYKYLDAISRFKNTYGKIIKP